MNDQRFSDDELEFMQAMGVQPGDLDVLVADAPDLPEQSRALVQQLTWAKIHGATGPAPGGAVRENLGGRLRRWLTVAAAAAAVCVVAVGVSPAAQAALQRLLQYVPGIGITETEAATLVLATPVTVSGDRGSLTIKGFLATAAYSELRYEVTGITSDKADVEPAPGNDGGAALVMPDGTRLAMTGAMAAGGAGNQSGTITFPALPSLTDEVTVELDGLFGLPGQYAASLKLVTADNAGLATARQGSQSAAQHGITVSVPHLAFVGDRIFLTLATELELPALRRDFIARTADNLILRDDMGHAYELLEAESNEYGDSGGPLSAVFAGPVQAGAMALHLSVNEIAVVEQGSARLRIPLSQLPFGERLEPNRTLAIGRWTVNVHAVTRVAEDEFDLELSFSGTEDTGSTLQYVGVRPYKNRGGYGYSYEPDPESERALVAFSYEPGGKNLDLELYEPTVVRTGPWQIALPLN